jgi:hypothetical protein
MQMFCADVDTLSAATVCDAILCDFVCCGQLHHLWIITLLILNNYVYLFSILFLDFLRF